jgi:hypothetical protein
VRDADKVAVFLRDFREFEANYDGPDPEKRLPNYIVMSMPEDHTRGATPGAYTRQAIVANNDYAIGQLVDAVSHSRYWPIRRSSSSKMTRRTEPIMSRYAGRQAWSPVRTSSAASSIARFRDPSGTADFASAS